MSEHRDFCAGNKRGHINLLLPEGAEGITAAYFSKVKSHSFGVAIHPRGEQVPYFTTAHPLKSDSDGGLWWQAGVDCVGMHCFIRVQLRNGLLVFPLCLISPGHRRFAWVVAETTKIERYNQREASILIANKMPAAYPVTFSAAPLCTALVTSNLFPLDLLHRWKSPSCPACSVTSREES